jgi:hypothetical protein
LNRLANVIYPINQAFEELCSHTAVLWPVIYFNLKHWHLLSDLWGELRPPSFQGIDNKITRLVRTAEANKQLTGILIHDATGRIGFFDTHIVVVGLPMTSRQSASRQVAELNRCLAVQAHSLSAIVLRLLIFKANILKD